MRLVFREIARRLQRRVIPPPSGRDHKGDKVGQESAKLDEVGVVREGQKRLTHAQTQRILGM